MPASSRLLLLFAVGTVAAACAGVSPRPKAADAAALPRVALSTDSARDLARHVERAIDAVVQLRYVEAEAEARAALELDPRSARARAVLGMVLFQRAGLDDPPDLFLANRGESELQLAEQLDPTDPFVGWMHAVLLAEAGHMSAAAAQAEAALARAGDRTPQERAALLGAAGTYRYELGEERAAVPHLQAYVALRPDDATASFRLGWCLLRLAGLVSGPRPNSLQVAQGQADAAVRSFRRCAQLVPGDDDVALAVGVALLRGAELAEELQDPDGRDERRRDAEASFREVAARFPGNAEALFRAGVTAEARGDEVAAREDYTAALQRDPEHLGSLLHLAACQQRAGATDGDPAQRELLQRALRVGTERGSLTDAERAQLAARFAAGATRP
ncbi:MAG: tetratricopeptide repeat protein [Planctomycetes bacterium]|nr:tetratricopeptide repeat protein [Planctomycetota bacterium]